MNFIQKAIAFAENVFHIGGGASAPAQAATSTAAINADIQNFENGLEIWKQDGLKLATLGQALGAAVPVAGPAIEVVCGYVTGAITGITAVEKGFDAALAAAEKAGGYTGTPPSVPAS